MIAISQPKMRKILEAEGNLKWKAPGAKYAAIISVIIILATFIGQFFIENGWVMIVSGIIWLVFTFAYYELVGKRRFLEVQAAKQK